MKILKPLLFAATTTILLTSCGSAVRPINAALLKNTNEKTTKTTKIEDAQLKSWSYTDLASDTIPGMSVDKAYVELIPNLKGTKVIVAVIDSGVDIEHEDLKNINDRIKNAGKKGVNGVPCFIIDNQYVLQGAQSTELWIQVIDETSNKNNA